MINSLPFLIVGMMTERGILDGFFDDIIDDIIYVPLTTGQLHLFGGDPDLHTIVVQAARPDQVAAAAKAITELMRKGHQSDDFEVYNMTEEIKRSARTQDTRATLLGAIAVISLINGGIGVMNVMLMTVKERTREIGIRIATGARIGDILHQFLIEAMAIAALGGILGVIAGMGAAAALQTFMSIPVRLSPAAIAGAFVSALATGLVFGFIPALQAARLDPAATLAHE